MDAIKFQACDVAILLCSTPNGFTACIMRDRLGGMAVNFTSFILDEYVLGLMATASYCGHVVVVDSNTTELYINNHPLTHKAFRNSCMLLEEFLLFIAECYGPPATANWAKYERIKHFGKGSNEGSNEATQEDIAVIRKREGLCPTCGENGAMVRMALICSTHGPYAGI